MRAAVDLHAWLKQQAGRLEQELARGEEPLACWRGAAAVWASWREPSERDGRDPKEESEVEWPAREWAAYLWARRLPPNLLPGLIQHFFLALPLLETLANKSLALQAKRQERSWQLLEQPDERDEPCKQGKWQQFAPIPYAPLAQVLIRLDRWESRRVFMELSEWESPYRDGREEPLAPTQYEGGRLRVPLGTSAGVVAHALEWQTANSRQPEMEVMAGAALAKALAALGLAQRFYQMMGHPDPGQEDELELTTTVALLLEASAQRRRPFRLLGLAQLRAGKTLQRLYDRALESPPHSQREKGEWAILQQSFAIHYLRQTMPELLKEAAPQEVLDLFGPRGARKSRTSQDYREPHQPEVKPGAGKLKPLAGLRVIDLSRLYPGPMAGKLLLDLGAQVTKVEFAGMPDPMRNYPPLVEGKSSGYLAVNGGKAERSFDLARAEEREGLHECLATSDFLLESFRPGVLKELGLDYQTLAERHPQLILASVTGYGQDGPLSGRAGHDLNYLAESGLSALFAGADGSPLLPAVQMADIAGGAYMAVIGMLAALQNRRLRGRGCWIDIAMTAGVLPLASLQLAHQWAGEQQLPGHGLLAGRLACYNYYQAGDKDWFALAALEPKFWQRFCKAVERPEWIGSQFAQGQEAEELKTALKQLFASKKSEHWQSLAARVDCCLNRLKRPDELADSKFLNERGLFRQQELGETRYRILDTPLIFNE